MNYMYLYYIISHVVGPIVKTRITSSLIEREREREVGGDGVYGCSFGEPLKQETFQTSLYIQTRV
jgi:hypothetical protein